jgi:hypothetical protein
MDVLFQILPNELGLKTIVDIRGAEMLQTFVDSGGDIQAAAHSQGTMSFYQSLDLLNLPGVHSRITYAGAGPEMIMGDGLGLNNTTSF